MKIPVGLRVDFYKSKTGAEKSMIIKTIEECNLSEKQ